MMPKKHWQQEIKGFWKHSYLGCHATRVPFSLLSQPRDVVNSHSNTSGRKKNVTETLLYLFIFINNFKNQCMCTHTQMLPVMAMWGQRWGLHMTATTAIWNTEKIFWTEKNKMNCSNIKWQCDKFYTKAHRIPVSDHKKKKECRQNWSWLKYNKYC